MEGSGETLGTAISKNCKSKSVVSQSVGRSQGTALREKLITDN